jgi:hypothetical protein
LICIATARSDDSSTVTVGVRFVGDEEVEEEVVEEEEEGIGMELGMGMGIQVVVGSSG